MKPAAYQELTRAERMWLIREIGGPWGRLSEAQLAFVSDERIINALDLMEKYFSPESPMITKLRRHYPR